jgi:hypothetical protein
MEYADTDVLYYSKYECRYVVGETKMVAGRGQAAMYAEFCNSFPALVVLKPLIFNINKNEKNH